jgi:hypothetical protein
MPAPIVNFDVDDLISSYLGEKKLSSVGAKLKILRKKKVKKIGAVDAASTKSAASSKSIIDEDFFDEGAMLEALKTNSMSAGDIERVFGMSQGEIVLRYGASVLPNTTNPP